MKRNWEFKSIPAKQHLTLTKRVEEAVALGFEVVSINHELAEFPQWWAMLRREVFPLEAEPKDAAE